MHTKVSHYSEAHLTRGKQYNTKIILMKTMKTYCKIGK